MVEISLQVVGGDDARSVGSDSLGVASVHDFRRKILQPGIIGSLKAYVHWMREARGLEKSDEVLRGMPNAGPFSINLDLTTACNYACDHCVDMDILNTGVNYNHDKLMSSLKQMIDRGLRSAIIIGGGEPTLYPKFGEVVEHLKANRVQVAVVTNGSQMGRVEKIAHLFDSKDWVRLSLDAGTDATFQAMHKPKKPVTLEEICHNVQDVKKKHPNMQIGFSYIITWNGATTNDATIVENLHEIPDATALAKRSGFDYISFKAFLDREENGAEVIGVPGERKSYDDVLQQIRKYLDVSKKYEGGDFRVIESTNLKAFKEDKSDLKRQPAQCHMTFFRQVVNPLGTYICPVYRNVRRASVGTKDAYSTSEQIEKTYLETARRVFDFDASRECKDITCIYNSVNWFIEGLISNPEELERVTVAEDGDYFL